MLESVLAAFLQVGVVWGVEQQATDVEGDGEPLLLLLSDRSLLCVITRALRGVGERPGRTYRSWPERIDE